MDQMSRMATLDAFREGRITLLAASDVAARGLDIPDVSHIFNFDVPWQSDDYVHRIGRTGRAGKEGHSLTIVTPDEFGQLKDIERMLGAPVTWIGEGPSAEELSAPRRRGGRRGRDQRSAGTRQSPRPHASPGRNGGQREQRNGNALASRGKPRSSISDTASTQPEHAPRSAASKDGPRTGGSQRKQENPQPPRQARPPRQGKQTRMPWEARPPRQTGGNPSAGKSGPIGLGDHVPAFLKKAVRPAH
jgi:superfamily II DNA/RNA helicase